MNTVDLRDFVYKRAAEIFAPPLTQNDIHLMTNIFFDGIAFCLLNPPEDIPEDKEHTVNIRGFGKFSVRRRKGRVYTVRGEQHRKEDRFTVVFKPGSELKRGLSKLSVD